MCPLGRQGMYFELLGSFVEAEQLYQKELDNDPTNAMVLKRMVSSQAPACVPHKVAARKHAVSSYSCDCGEFGMDNEKWTWPHWRARCALRGLLRAPGVQVPASRWAAPPRAPLPAALLPACMQCCLLATRYNSPARVLPGRWRSSGARATRRALQSC